ncbi:MAG TPA: AbrB/MazE/SpoVT family DNA-binding domain-containing protein [Candidatus Wunengus sp. YC63]|uniref:AbrB/MazE/SpoVT family DNA-binding domain-containing protein n=1 Tax=unclassified Candidatus Wunengus TaxID=3367695 RepID=UPI001DB66C78|nr:AbrB/MazE/SpoVT family DNA-binding domain-containing protein [Planctomycetota bacterium]MBI5794925.1 AbrB/MazE/SpoVT family DNA-binding domain-containing protein [Planctomycetota bacterium]
METSVVTSKGQVVIPSKLRHKYGIKNGTRVHFYEVNGEIRLVPVTPELIDKNIGLLGTKGKLMRALQEEKKREREL